MKALLVVVAACAALGVAPAATAADRLVERGIVQSADRAGLVLRALDGTEVTVAVAPQTRFRLNGRPASLADIRSGFVAEVVTLVPGGPAAVVRAFGRARGQRRSRPARRGSGRARSWYGTTRRNRPDPGHREDERLACG